MNPKYVALKMVDKADFGKKATAVRLFLIDSLFSPGKCGSDETNLFVPEQLTISFVRLVTFITWELSVRCIVCFHMPFQRAFILHAYTANMTRVPK